MRFTFTLASLVLVSALASTASASTSTTAHTAGHLQLSVPMDVLGVEYGERDWPTGGQHSGWSAGVGYGRYASGPIFPALPNVELGYGVSDAWLVHVQLGVSRSTDEYEGGHFERAAFRVAPGLSYVLAAGELVRPAFGVRVAIDRFGGDGDAGTGLGVSARAGAQIHTGDHFSIDPYLELAYRYFSDEQDSGGQGGLAGLYRGEQRSVGLSGGFALSLWL